MDNEQRLIAAEVKAAAVAAGIVDPDAVRLLDLSAVKLNEAGDAVIPAGFFDAARASKPYLFRNASTSTSNPTAPPPPGELRQRRAVDMTDAERRAWKIANGIPVAFRR